MEALLTQPQTVFEEAPVVKVEHSEQVKNWSSHT
jgi:hypothetical protein